MKILLSETDYTEKHTFTVRPKLCVALNNTVLSSGRRVSSLVSFTRYLLLPPLSGQTTMCVLSSIYKIKCLLAHIVRCTAKKLSTFFCVLVFSGVNSPFLLWYSFHSVLYYFHYFLFLLANVI